MSNDRLKRLMPKSSPNTNPNTAGWDFSAKNFRKDQAFFYNPGGGVALWYRMHTGGALCCIVPAHSRHIPRRVLSPMLDVQRPPPVRRYGFFMAEFEDGIMFSILVCLPG